MITYILPGFSLANKNWAEDIKAQLEPKLPVSIYYWQHWATGNPESDWITAESGRIAQKIASGEKSYSIIAKSIGTTVAGAVIKLLSQPPEKIIFCGLPINDFLPKNDTYYDLLKSFPAQKILCLQNESDPHGSSAMAEEFYGKLNPKIKIVPMPRSDHEYPYPEEFKKFLAS